MPRTRVVTDLSQLAPGGENGGAARFVLDLLGALVRVEGLDFTLLVRPAAASVVEPLRAAGARVVLLRPGGEVEEPRRLRRTLRRLPGPLARAIPDLASLRRLGTDVLFSPLQSAVFHEPGLPHVAVAYDVQELHHPDFFSAEELRRRAAFRADLRRASHIVAISEATRLDLLERVSLRPDRVTVIHPAGPSERRPLPADALSARLAGLGLTPGGYALYPANFWPHKNHERLLRAVASSPLASDPSFRLVLCGALDDRRQAVEALASSLDLTARVLFLGYQPDDEMTALLQGTRFLVFPSLFEGFGIPVVEAFRLGVPVACSDVPALREVANDAALLLDPTDEIAIADAIANLWRDEGLRLRLAARARARAAHFAPASVAPAYAVLLGSLS